MRVVVITGGLGSGKSTAAEHFRSLGAVVVDLDQVANNLLSANSALLIRVADEFGGDEVLLADGSLDRAALARAAFATPESARRLDAIMHPVIAREVGVAIDQLRLMPQPPSVVVIEVPLLVEAPVFAELADVVLALVAPEDLRVARAVSRGLREDDARRRVRAQATDAERAALSDVVVVNDGDMSALIDALDRFWEEYVAVGGANR